MTAGGQSPASAEASPRPRVLVYGAGAIGLLIGGRLAAAGLPVHFIARPAVVEALLGDGLRLTGLHGDECHVPAAALSAGSGLDDAPAPTLVLLTVKGGGTTPAAQALGAAMPGGTPVLSFQNGVDNPDRIRATAPGLVALAGMVPFNVVQSAPNAVRQATSGVLAAEDHPATRAFAAHFAGAGLPLTLHPDMRGVQWGKLLVNLNNPLNALAGIPLLEELQDRRWRQLLADLQDEALAVLRAAAIAPARATPLPPRWLPTLLRLPTPIFRMLARRMLTIDPAARSSMQDDRRRGRGTEVDDLCGAVVRLARQVGAAAPRNAALARLVGEATPGRWYGVEEVRASLGGA